MKKQLDEFSWHEALDRTFLISQSIENTLLIHPVIKKHYKLKVEKILNSLYDVYQEIGAHDIEKINKKDGSNISTKQIKRKQ